MIQIFPAYKDRACEVVGGYLGFSFVVFKGCFVVMVVLGCLVVRWATLAGGLK
jgi:hypothetical protein